MNLDTDFYEALTNKDINALRAMIQNSLIIDPSLEEYNEMMESIEGECINIFETHDNKYLEENLTLWTKEYFNEESTQLMFNFSKERLELLSRMARKLYGSRSSKHNSGNNAYNKSEYTHSNRNTDNKNSFNKGIVENIINSVINVLKGFKEKNESFGDFLIDAGEKLIKIGERLKK